MIEKLKLIIPKWVTLFTIIFVGFYIINKYIPTIGTPYLFKIFMCILYVCMVWVMFVVMNSYNIYLLIFGKVPINVLTDYGYRYIHVLDGGGDEGSITLNLMKNNFFYWKMVKSSKDKKIYEVNDVFRIKRLINNLCVPEECSKSIYDIISENEIMTDKKEVLRDMNINKILENENI